MTVVSFLGPDKRHIKASSDFQLSFFIALSDFFQEKRCFSDSKHTEQNNHNGSVTTISIQKY